MSIHPDDAGTLRTIRGVYADDAGVLRTIQSGYVNDNGTLRKFWSASGLAAALVAGTDGAATGYVSTALAAHFGSLTPHALVSDKSYDAIDIYRLSTNVLWIRLQAPSGDPSPADADTTWKTCDIIGVFADSGGATVTRSYTRAGADITNVAGPANSRNWGYGAPQVTPQFISGNTYQVRFAL